MAEARAFVTKANGLANKLINDVLVISGDKNILVKAQWDTGATGTCISEKVRNDLGLIRVSTQKICTPTGQADADVCLVDVGLPNSVLIRGVPVVVTKIGDQGIGMLIGMNIIGMGDFAVSNFEGKTTFTFRIPSQKITNYVAEVNYQNVIGPKHGNGKRKKKKK